MLSQPVLLVVLGEQRDAEAKRATSESHASGVRVIVSKMGDPVRSGECL
jgi:hypothetical protein